MTTDDAGQLFRYGSWANAQMFSAAEALPREHLEASAPSSFPTVSATLGHIIGAEWIWLRRWLGDSPSGMPSWATQPNLKDIKSRLSNVETERASLLARLTNADLDGAFAYRGFDGKPISLILGQQMQHVVNHSTYHRGQLSTQLRQLGHSPPNTDLSRFLRESK